MLKIIEEEGVSGTDKIFASVREVQDLKDTNTENISPVVNKIISDIRNIGDEAVIDYCNKFDNANATQGSDLVITATEIDEAYAKLKEQSPDFIEALHLAQSRVEAYHKKTLPEDLSWQDEYGNNIGNKWTSVETAAVYVPSGTAVYPSSLIMSLVPAQVAKVDRILVLTPARDGKVDDGILAAMKVCNVYEGYKVGGAVAVAAVTFGTDTIPKANKIVGPGNGYVATAKKILYGRIGIDCVAGPSDITIIADETAKVNFVSHDLLAQAEHGRDSSAILITNSLDFAKEVQKTVSKLAISAKRTDILKDSIGIMSRILVVKNLSTTGVKIANQIAPEHLEIVTKNYKELQGKIRNAGAIFLNNNTCEALGDYVLGPSHTLPTSGTAAFSSGLSCLDFLKKTSVMEITNQSSLAKLCQSSAVIAKKEELEMHEKSALVRLNQDS